MSDIDKFLEKLASVKLAVFDVDGVMTDGGLVFTESDEELKLFHVHDGLGLVMLKRSGCEVAVISSRSSKIVARRMAELGITHVYQGQHNKCAALMLILNELNLDKTEAVYTGDDLVDIPAMKEVGTGIAVANARPLVKEQADWTTETPGGAGAVREVCELILRAQGKLDGIFNEYLQ
ncbi:MAG: HAD-IIIA family hydrolase [Gammaproteobacteria bacterium]